MFGSNVFLSLSMATRMKVKVRSLKLELFFSSSDFSDFQRKFSSGSNERQPVAIRYKITIILVISVFNRNFALLAVCFPLEISAGIMRRDYLA